MTVALVPSSVTSYGDTPFRNCTSLTQLYINMATPPTVTLTDVPSTCKIYVPTGRVKNYKNASGWSSRANYIEAGAYDFNFGSSGFSSAALYHMTITSNTPVTYNGTTYAGTAKYVYHPNNKTTTSSTFSPGLYESDYMCGSGKKYLITEVADSALAYLSSSITSINFSSCTRLTRLGIFSFYAAGGLTEVELPNSLTTIALGAFENCKKLASISIPNSVTSIGNYTFYDCSSLDDVSWSTAVTFIPNYCFTNARLNNYKVPNWIKQIGTGAFSGVTGLKNMILPYGMKTINADAFKGSSITTLLIPSSVNSLSSSAFVNCQSLKEVYCNMAAPMGVDVTGLPTTARFYVPVEKVARYKATSGWSNRSSYVGAGAFDYNFGSGYNPSSNYHMTILTTTPVTYDGTTYAGTAKYVYHPNIQTATAFSANFREVDNMCGSDKPYLITEIGDSCFFEATNIATVQLSKCVKLTKIGAYAFCGAESLASVPMPNSLTTIGMEAFEGCTSLTSVTIPNSVTSIGTYVFYDCSSLKSVAWSTGLNEIPQSTFSQCVSLADFTIPHWVTAIGDWAFFNTGMTKAIVPYGVKSIGKEAFLESNIATALIPSSVTSLSNNAFKGCTSLNTLYCNMATPPSMTFTGVPANCKFYVPVGKVQQYKKASGWTNRATYIDAGAYDFNYGSKGYDPASGYFMTITSTTPVTVDGVTYAGTAKYVFHPSITNCTFGTFTGSLYETDNMCGSDKKYIMTEVGDSCLRGSSASLTTIDLRDATRLTKLGQDAMWLSKAKEVYLPASVTNYSSYSIFFMNSLTDLYVENPTPASVAGNTFHSDDYTHTTLHVPSQKAVYAYKNAPYWKNFYKIVTDEPGIPGDVNGDGEVNIGDINAIISVILGGASIPGADVNGDGEVNIGDVNTVIDIILS